MPKEIRDFASVFAAAGKRCYIVGGALRDSLLGRPVHDFDAATDALPDEVLKLFRKVIPTGIKHGTVTVLWKGFSIETTTFRRDMGYSDGRRPDMVHYGASLEEDLERRDFTINAMAWDPLDNELVDLHGGKEDLSRRLIRAVGDPRLRFDEDGLRPLRALRFSAQLGFEIEGSTLAAVPGALHRTRLVSHERVREELEKTLVAPLPSPAFLRMEETGLLAVILPELSRCRGVDQKGFHRFDVLDHSLATMDASFPILRIRLAALFHDIGKVDTREPGADGTWTFHRHEEASARMALAVMRRLKFPNAECEAVTHLIRSHMFNYEEQWTDAAVRRFLARVGPDYVEELFALRLADTAGKDGSPPDERGLEPFRKRIGLILEAGHALGIKDLAIGGNDLAAIGIAKGPAMGRLLADLLSTVMDDPGQNTRDRLLDIAARTKERY